MEFVTNKIPFIGFGTDGVRGNTNGELTAQFALELGCAAAKFLKTDMGLQQIIVGKDTRASCDMLGAALSAGLMGCGVDVIDVGVITTPGVAYAAREKKIPAAVISASHNLAEYNGIKFFSPDGYKFSEEEEARVESIVREQSKSSEKGFGKYNHDITNRMEYKRFLETTVDCDFGSLRVGLDCANGAAYHIAPGVFSDLGAKVLVIGDKPDGKNINQEYGSTAPSKISKLVIENGLDIGFAFDGDGDRVIAVDEDGKEIDGDHIIAILAKQMAEESKLKNKSVVVTVMTNIGFDIAMEEMGITVYKCAVGDRNVIDKMVETETELGGEQSGHIILGKYMPTGDGILTGLQLLRVMKKTEKPLSILSSVMKKAPQRLVNIKVADKSAFSASQRIRESIENVSSELGSTGRILVRPSGTEPLIRVMVEAQDKSLVDKHSQDIAEVICRELNGIAIEG